MKLILPFLILSIQILSAQSTLKSTSDAVPLPNMQSKPFGINLAGAEFGHPVSNPSYIYPTNEELDYFYSKGFRMVRLPIKWEYVQPTLNGALDATNLSSIHTFVDNARQKGLLVNIDLHNYCRRYINGSEKIIGDNELSTAHLVDFWKKLATELKDKENIYAYGIMNEPHDLRNDTPWKGIVQEVITAIRTIDTQTQITVCGDSWASAERWLSYSDNLKDLSDPSGKLIFEAHVYFDNDASGKYDSSYDGEGTTVNTGINRVQPFLNWLSDNNLQGFIGEYGIPANDNRWNTTLDKFLDHISKAGVNGTYWAAGPWWGDYILSVEPNSDGSDKAQMATLEKYLFASTPTSSPTEIITPEKPYPNPFTSFITFPSTNDNHFIEIYNHLGSVVFQGNTSNNTVNGLDGLAKGIYLIKVNRAKVYKMVKQ